MNDYTFKSYFDFVLLPQIGEEGFEELLSEPSLTNLLKILQMFADYLDFICEGDDFEIH